MRMIVLSTALIVATATAAFAQAEPSRYGDRYHGRTMHTAPVAGPKILRRDDAMAPLVQDNFNSRNVAGRPQEFGNNPTPTRNDPPGTRTQCRGGCQ